ncbi:MAG: hypothetical protein K6B52_08190 [Clostridiales bacterium]|nr:hypothetical protein [Clostridiales bacterium]
MKKTIIKVGIIVIVLAAVACGIVFALSNSKDNAGIAELTGTAAPTSEVYREETESETLPGTETVSENETVSQTDAVSEQTTEAVTAEETIEETTKAPGKAEIVEIFNKSVNSVKKNASSVYLNYCENSLVDEPVINNRIVEKVASRLIEANMGVNEKDELYSSRSDIDAKFPLANKSYSSTLTAGDISDASYSVKDGKAEIVIKILRDEPGIDPDKAHINNAFDTVKKSDIVEGAGDVGMAFIKEPSIKVGYKNGVIKAVIDEKTGELLTVNYYHEWSLTLSTTVGLNVTIWFGLEKDYRIDY